MTSGPDDRGVTQDQFRNARGHQCQFRMPACLRLPFPWGLLEVLAQVPDSRRARGRRFPWASCWRWRRYARWPRPGASARPVTWPLTCRRRCWQRGVGDGQVKLLAAMLHEDKVIIGQVQVPDDTTETHVREPLKDLDLENAVVTADAVHACRETAQHRRQQAGGKPGIGLDLGPVIACSRWCAAGRAGWPRRPPARCRPAAHRR
jgi:hypothetical protein